MTTSPFPTALYQQSDVSRSLGLSDRQATDLSRLSQTLQSRFANDFQGLTRLPAADQVARRQELERQYQQDFLAGARDVFDARQLNRYQQLNYQFGGFNSLSDPAVQRQLGLTPAQARDLQASIDWSNGQTREINALALTDRERATRLYADYQKAYQDRFNRFLTPEQQRSWTTLTGEQYTFPPYFPTAPAGTATGGLAPGTAPPGTLPPGTAPAGTTPTTGGTTPPGTPTTGGSPPKQ